MVRSFKSGEILRYPYLWDWQALRGEKAGRKVRPVCVAMPLRKAGQTHLWLLAITSTQPGLDQKGISIPDAEARRAGLKFRKPGWIIVSEYNYDIAEKSYFLEPAQEPAGRFSETFTGKVRTELRAMIVAKSAILVDRTK